MVWFGYVATVCVGLVLGMLGGGGSILSIPIFVYMFGYDPVTASGYSLFVVGVTSSVGTVLKYKEQLVDFPSAFFFGLPSLISIYITRRWFLPSIPDIIYSSDAIFLSKRMLLLGVFSTLMILASYFMISGRNAGKNEGLIANPMILSIEGLIIGFLTGLVGAGGGFLIIPALIFVTGLPFKTAAATSLIIIAINSFVGFLGDAPSTQFEWPLLLTLSLLAIVGVLIGNVFSKKVSQEKLRKAFGWFVLVIGIFVFFKEIILTPR